MDDFKFHKNQRVTKVLGYKLHGVVLSCYLTTKGEIRYVVEHEGGFQHVYKEEQLAVRGSEGTRLIIDVIEDISMASKLALKLYLDKLPGHEPFLEEQMKFLEALHNELEEKGYGS